MLEFALLAAFAAGGWFWWDSLRAREAANAAMRPACQARGLLFLDDTVALAQVRPARDTDGRVRLRRVYRFEVSASDDKRRSGAVTLLGARIVGVDLPGA